MNLENILTTLEKLGWQVQKDTFPWYYAYNETQNHALLFAILDNQNPNLSAPQNLANCKKRDAFIFCCEGVKSNYLRQPNLTGIQTWFLDMNSGSIFPYPPTKDHRVLHWVLQLNRDASYEQPISQLPLETKKKPTSYVTYIIIALNLLIFSLMTLAGGSTNTRVLILFGAKVNNLILQGEIWRFLTSIFIHIGFMHLAFNLYALWALGPFAEELIGHRKFFITYLVSGICGGIASFLFAPELSAGASGAIFGLLGTLLLHSLKHPYLWKSGLGLNLIIIIGINLGLSFVQPQIDIYAHLGGLITGFLLGFALDFHKIQT